MDGLWLGSWLRFLTGTRLGPYVPTPHHVGARMLALARVTASDCVYDVGCGDGRLLVAAATRHGATAVGYELDPTLAAAASAAAAAAGVGNRVRVERADARSACFAPADVVCLYLSERGNGEMLPRLRDAATKRAAAGRAPARAVTFTFPVPGLTPAATTTVDGIKLYLYEIRS